MIDIRSLSKQLMEKTPSEARKILRGLKMELRIVSSDGKNFTNDPKPIYTPTRVNVVVINGVIAEIEGIG